MSTRDGRKILSRRRAKRLRPLARRRLKIFLPSRVDMRLRNPCLRFLFLLLFLKKVTDIVVIPVFLLVLRAS